LGGWRDTFVAVLLVSISGCGDSNAPPKVNPPRSTRSADVAQTVADAADSEPADEQSKQAEPSDESGDSTASLRESPPDDSSSDDTSPDEAASESLPDEPATEDGNSEADVTQEPDNSNDGAAEVTLFREWPKPRLALLMTGEQLGYIEPCGCTGLENQKGGLRRRHTLLKQLRDNSWPVVALDNGGLINGFGRQSEIKFEKTAEALMTMGYTGVGFGTDDLKLSAGSLVSVLANNQENPFVSANVRLGIDGYPRRLIVVEQGGIKLGITAVLGDAFQKQINNADVGFLPAEEGLAVVYKELDAENCDRLILLAHAAPDDTAQLAKRFPKFAVVVTAGGADEPPHEPVVLNDGRTLMIEVGHKGMYAVVVGFYDDKVTPVRYQRVPIDKRFSDSPEMDQVMVDYQNQLQQEGWDGLGLRPAKHPGGKFAGSARCADCHATEFNVWKNSPHADATQTLLTKTRPPRQYDPECVSCHVTGWNPQDYFPYGTGFDSLKSTPALVGNGCENCHGPSAAHAAAEEGDIDKLKEQWRGKLHLSIADNKKAIVESCMECHDQDNSADFKFETYWPKIEH
jgi:hypothetical protein